MSRSHRASIASCSKSDPTLKDETGIGETSKAESIKSASWETDYLQSFAKITCGTLESPLFGELSEILDLQDQPLCQHTISFKSLPPLGAKDSLENILRIRKHSKFPRRNLLKSLVKTNGLERRPRRRLCQNKTDTVAGSKKPDTSDSETRPEENVKRLWYKLANEKKVLNRFSIGRFGRNIRNRIRGEAPKSKVLSYGGVISVCKDEAVNLQISPKKFTASMYSCCSDIERAVSEFKLQASKANELLDTPNESYSSVDMLRSLEMLNLNPGELEATVRPESRDSTQQTLDNETKVNLESKRNDFLTWLTNASNVGTIPMEKHNDKCGSKFHEPNEMKRKIVYSQKREEAKENCFTTLQPSPSNLDFSSGDDTRNVASDAACGEEKMNHDYETRTRSVQWNSEVDVIYYAGDTDGGKVIRRKIEPLREEADQQARRNVFIELALKKNLNSAFNAYKFQDSWQ